VAGSGHAQLEDAEWSKACTAHLGRRIARMLHELGVPATTTIDLTREGALDDEANGFRVEVAGRRCRLDWTAGPLPSSMEPRQFAERVFEALFWNRTAFLTPEVVDRLEAQGESRAAESGSPSDLARILEYAVRHGYSVSTAQDTLARWRIPGRPTSDPDVAFEWMLAHHFPRDVVLELGRQVDIPDAFHEMVNMVRDGLFYELGIKCPSVRTVFDEDLEGNQFRARIGEVTGPVQCGLSSEEYFVNASPELLLHFNVSAVERLHPAALVKYSVVQEKDLAACRAAGLTTWDHLAVAGLTLGSIFRRHAALFILMPYVEHMLKRLDEAFPMPVFNVLERWSLTILQGVLRRLVEEGVSIRNLRDVLESLLHFEGAIATERPDLTVIFPAGRHVVRRPGTDERRIVHHLAEHTRSALKYQLTDTYAGSFAFATGPRMEARLHDPHPLSAAERDRMRGAVGKVLRDARLHRAVLVTGSSVRRSLYELLSFEFPGLVVLAREEIAPGSELDILETIEPFEPAGRAGAEIRSG
jgi:hypothetical protein